MHAAFAAVVVVCGQHAPRLHVADGTSIEVDEIAQAKPVDTLEEPTEPVRVATVHASPMRGSPVSVLAVAPTDTAPSRDVVPDPPIVAPRFSTTLGAGGDGLVTKPAGPAVASDRVFAESEVTERATLTSGPKPQYPADALHDSIEPDEPLAFEIVVDTNGAVMTSRPLNHAGHGFDEAALAALRAYRFSPAKRDGERVRVRMRWTVDFHFKS